MEYLIYYCYNSCLSLNFKNFILTESSQIIWSRHCLFSILRLYHYVDTHTHTHTHTHKRVRKHLIQKSNQINLCGSWGNKVWTLPCENWKLLEALLLWDCLQDTVLTMSCHMCPGAPWLVSLFSRDSWKAHEPNHMGSCDSARLLSTFKYTSRPYKIPLEWQTKQS